MIPIDFFKSKTSKENYSVWEKFWASNNHELHKLTSKKINSFLDDFTNLDLFKKEMSYNSDSSNEDKFQDIDKISRVNVEIYYENGDMEEFRLINRFPEKWMEF